MDYEQETEGDIAAREFFEKHGIRPLTEGQSKVLNLIGRVRPRPGVAVVPAHTRTALPHSEQGNFCSRGGTLAPNGRCPDGCDHEDHYANDGHPECEE